MKMGFKRSIKKTALACLLAFALCVTPMLVTGCRKKPAPAAVPVVERLELEETSVVLTLGDTVDLTASYNEIENGKLTWSSSSPSVASVDASGRVEAMKVGYATITARYGSKAATCEIEVGLASNVPTITFDGDVGKELTLMKGSVFGLGAAVRFNGKTFYDGQIEYLVADETIGSVINGEFRANNVLGRTTVSAFATWRGLTVRAESIAVTVIAESAVLLNEGRLTAVNLYTVDTHENKSYDNVQTITSVYISEDETEITEYTLSVLDEEIATIQKTGSTWQIRAQKMGETALIVAYGGKEVSFDVSVKRPVAQVEGTLSYSLTDEKYFDEGSQTLKGLQEIASGFGEITSYALGGREYQAANGKIDALVIGKDIGLTIYNETVGYKLTVDVYTTVFDELSDFAKIYAGDKKTVIKGSYMLAKDIIAPEEKVSMPSGKVSNDFAGTFDGKGHVLSFTFERGATRKFGLFGDNLRGATIKNIALSNVTMDGTMWSNSAGIICAECYDEESTFENVFVDITFSTARDSNLAFMGNAMTLAVLKNVIIHVPTVPEGSSAYGSYARNNNLGMSNSYIISTAPTYYNGSSSFTRNIPPRYESYEEMKAAGNDYSSFSEEFWDTTTHGIPVWKSLAGEFTLS